MLICKAFIGTAYLLHLQAEESDSRKRSRIEDASNGNDQPEKEQPHPKTSRISLKHLQEMVLLIS